MLRAMPSLPSLPLYGTVPGREEKDRPWLSALRQPLHSLAFAVPLLGALPQGRGRKKGTCLLVLGSTLYPQYPHSQGTKTDSPGLGSPTTALCSAARETMWKKNSLMVIVSQGNTQSQSSSARRFLFVKTGVGGGRTPNRLASARGQADLCLSYLLHVVTVSHASCQCRSSVS